VIVVQAKQAYIADINIPTSPRTAISTLNLPNRRCGGIGRLEGRRKAIGRSSPVLAFFEKHSGDACPTLYP